MVSFLPLATDLKSIHQLNRKTLVTETYTGEAEQNNVAQVKKQLAAGSSRVGK